VVAFSGVRVFDGDRFLDGARNVSVDGGLIVATDPAATRQPSFTAPRGHRGTDVRRGGVLFPGFVDAHVHLSFSAPQDVARGGVTTVLDFGAPPDYARSPHPPLRFRFAGTLLTVPGGYPTRSWGADGYGTELTSADEARDAVERWADAGAAIIKVALEPREGPTLDIDLLRAIVESAHARGLLVGAHALDADPVRLAVEAGADVLAHTPTAKLDDELIAACGSRRMWVVSTVRAFGGTRRTIRNLAALHEAGCRVTYGTDLGNGAIRPGIDVDELEILADVTGSVEGPLACACTHAGELAGGGGRIGVGEPADLVWLPSFERLRDLGSRKDVFIDGKLVS
jgi:imidazolonepropionase-like amidohydrolase